MERWVKGGNALEWVESAYDGSNDSGNDTRTQRGGYWCPGAGWLSSSVRIGSGPDYYSNREGFRVAMVPEPSEFAWVFGVAALGFALWRRRGSRRDSL